MQLAVRSFSKTLFVSTIVLVQLTFDSYGQKISEAAAIEAAAMKKIFEKDEIAAVRSVVNYEYFINPEGYLQAREKNKNQYIALKPNSSLVLRNYSNNHVSIESYSLKTEKDRNQLHDKYCGSSVRQKI
ncbi:MAG: hypothetical protein HYZ44_07465 [Bacteroidetes bacterium]|nr:hypothetical protein [Bacteroidota bacterium]